MGKGSGRRPLLISEQEAEDNWNKIFKKNYEYELNKSTGEVEKRFIDGISKPNNCNVCGRNIPKTIASKLEKTSIVTIPCVVRS